MPLILDEIHWDAHSFLVFFSAAMIFFIYLMRQLKVEEAHKPLDALDLHSEDAQAFTKGNGNGKPVQETTPHRDPIRQPH